MDICKNLSEMYCTFLINFNIIMVSLPTGLKCTYVFFFFVDACLKEPFELSLSNIASERYNLNFAPSAFVSLTNSSISCARAEGRYPRSWFTNRSEINSYSPIIFTLTQWDKVQNTYANLIATFINIFAMRV